MKEFCLLVNGMHCEGCEKRIENVLLKEKNVKKVVANHQTGEVKISYKKEIDVEKIKEKIEVLGFSCK